MALSKETLQAIKHFGPSVNHLARKRYHISGQELLGKAIQGESGDNPRAVSPVGARGRAQFMPSSRDVAIKRFGVDPWGSADDAVHAMALHLRGKINGSKGLEGYNPGDPSYAKYILGQQVKVLGGKTKGGATSTKVDGYTVTSHKFGKPERTVQDVDGAVLDALMNRKGGSLLKAVSANLDSGKFTKTIPGTKDKTIKTKVAGGTIEGVTAKAPPGHGGIATFEGKPVAAWMVPALQYARAHGWKGHVTSGVRTRAEQKVLYANRAHNPYPVAAPGSSNHEIENGGAIDASDYSTLASIMEHYPGKKLVQGTAIGDPVHFSHNGH